MKVNVESYQSNWWMYFVGGLATLLFGFVTVINPALTLVALSFFIGLYFLVGGAVEMVLSLTSSRTKSLWLLSLLFGALQAVIGIYLLQRPHLVLATFVVFVALALLVRGVLRLVEAFDSQYDNVYRSWQAIAGVVALLASVLVWRYPVKGGLAFVWILGLYAIIDGPLMIAFALEAKKGFSSK